MEEHPIDIDTCSNEIKTIYAKLKAKVEECPNFIRICRGLLVVVIMEHFTILPSPITRSKFAVVVYCLKGKVSLLLILSLFLVCE